jgi:imidazolonepropionase-like amidohydrolase
LHIDDKVGSIKVGKDADIVYGCKPTQFMLKQKKQLSKVQYTMMLKDEAKRVAVNQERSNYRSNA